MKKTILIVAGEPSGDTVGGLLSSELKIGRPDYDLFGLGGDNMDISGVDILYHIKQLAFLGFWEVLKHIPFIKEVEKKILEDVENRKPSLAILIDYPGFNLRLAKKLKKLGVPVMYYVSPQVWAWGEKRIEKIKQIVNKMVVVFDFEKELYKSHGMNVEWFGHPLLEIVKPQLSKDELYKKLNFKQDTKYIGLFPGSRIQEINKIFPPMIDAVNNAGLDRNKYKIVVGCAPGIADDIYKAIAGDDIIYTNNITYDLMTYSELNLVASGTATLECAMLGGPLFVLYKTSPITYQIAKRLVKIPYVGLVNVVARKKIAPEFIQGDCNGELIGKKINEYLSQSNLHEVLTDSVKSVKNKLGQPGASEKTARLAISMVESNNER